MPLLDFRDFYSIRRAAGKSCKNKKAKSRDSSTEEGSSIVQVAESCERNESEV